MNNEMLELPRWKNGPPICLEANLPAFPTWDDAKKFMEAHCGSDVVNWRCKVCGGWHYWANAKPPSGTSSGSSRRSTIPHHARQMIERTREKPKFEGITLAI